MTTSHFDVNELTQRLPPPPPALIRWLRAQGVSARALSQPELPAFAPVAFDARRPWFDFEDELHDDRPLTSALIFIARDEFGDKVDLVAWSQKTSRVASWLGRASLLGANEVFAARLVDEGALKVFATPLEWLQAERRGVVIVDEKRAGELLRLVSPLFTNDVDLGCRLEKITRAPAPRILVRRIDAEVAAA